MFQTFSIYILPQNGLLSVFTRSDKKDKYFIKCFIVTKTTKEKDKKKYFFIGRPRTQKKNYKRTGFNRK